MSNTDSEKDSETEVPHSSDTQTPREAILAGEIKAGMEELERPASGLFLSGISAGLDIGFGPLLMGIFLTLGGGSLSSFSLDFILASAYSVGFIFVIIGQSALFTELTTLASLPVLDGRASVSELARLWGFVYGGNIVGGVVFAASMVVMAPAYGMATPAAFETIANHLVNHGPWILLMGAVLAGWMMGLLSWLLTAVQESIARIFLVWMVTFGIGIGHLPHSIAGNLEVLAGMLVSESITFFDYLGFLTIATVGNAIGGVVFVALIKYGHVIRSEA